MKNPELFPDIENMADDIWKMNGKKHIDCKRVTFTNKCIMINVKNLTAQNYISLVRNFSTKNLTYCGV